jgi:hypothetical protein
VRRGFGALSGISLTSANIVTQELVMDDFKDLMSLAEAAEDLGIRPVSLRAAIERGTFRARKFGTSWVTTRQEVDRYARDRLGQVGRPPLEEKMIITGRVEDEDGNIISEPFKYDPKTGREIREPKEVEEWRRRPRSKEPIPTTRWIDPDSKPG